MQTKKATDYKRAFNEKCYDRVSVVVPKGRKDTVEAYARQHGETVNGMIGRLLREAIGIPADRWRMTPGEQDGETDE